jgi:hypothetical protein
MCLLQKTQEDVCIRAIDMLVFGRNTGLKRNKKWN